DRDAFNMARLAPAGPRPGAIYLANAVPFESLDARKPSRMTCRDAIRPRQSRMPGRSFRIVTSYWISRFATSDGSERGGDAASRVQAADLPPARGRPRVERERLTFATILGKIEGSDAHGSAGLRSFREEFTTVPTAMIARSISRDDRLNRGG